MKTLIAVIVALVVVGGGWWWYTTTMPAASPSTGTTINTNPNGQDYSPNGAPSSNEAGTGAAGGVGADINAGVTASTSLSASVAYTSSGPSPKTVTIKKGGTVTWTNQTSGDMWIASAPHPTHTGYDGTTEQTHCAAGYAGAAPFDECRNADTYSFTFNKVGSWNYHNHENPNQFGTVVVVE